jgi:hypothetical protein
MVKKGGKRRSSQPNMWAYGGEKYPKDFVYEITQATKTTT